MKTIFSWSGGKDSCLALHELRTSGVHDVSGLLTTITEGEGRISMHGVPRSLLKQQADALGLPLVEVTIPARCTNNEYETAFDRALRAFVRDGGEAIAFGDLFLEDIRAYRDALVARRGLTAMYPVWGRDTRKFVAKFIEAGFQAVTCCVDQSALGDAFAGRLLDEQFLAELPASVDPCGENGEFHTFVFDGPGFSRRVPFTVGPISVRHGSAFCDLQPVVQLSAQEQR